MREGGEGEGSEAGGMSEANPGGKNKQNFSRQIAKMAIGREFGRGMAIFIANWWMKYCWMMQIPTFYKIIKLEFSKYWVPKHQSHRQI